MEWEQEWNGNHQNLSNNCIRGELEYGKHKTTRPNKTTQHRQ